MYKRDSQRNGREFDGIISTERNVFLFEIKSNITKEYVDTFSRFVKSGKFFDFFPNMKGKIFIPIMGSIHLKEYQIQMLTDANILALSIKGDILTIRNFDRLIENH